MTRDPKRVRQGFRNGSKTVPKRFPTRFRTVFEPFRNLSRTVSISEPLSACAGKFGGTVFDLCSGTFSSKGISGLLVDPFSTGFPTRCGFGAVFGASVRPLNRLCKNVSSPAMHVHTPIPLFYKKEIGEREPILLKNYRYTTWPHGTASTSHFKEGCCARWRLGTREKKGAQKGQKFNFSEKGWVL